MPRGVTHPPMRRLATRVISTRRVNSPGSFTQTNAFGFGTPPKADAKTGGTPYSPGVQGSITPLPAKPPASTPATGTAPVAAAPKPGTPASDPRDPQFWLQQTNFDTLFGNAQTTFDTTDAADRLATNRAKSLLGETNQKNQLADKIAANRTGTLFGTNYDNRITDTALGFSRALDAEESGFTTRQQTRLGDLATARSLYAPIVYNPDGTIKSGGTMRTGSYFEAVDRHKDDPLTSGPASLAAKYINYNARPFRTKVDRAKNGEYHYYPNGRKVFVRY